MSSEAEQVPAAVEEAPPAETEPATDTQTSEPSEPTAEPPAEPSAETSNEPAKKSVTFDSDLTFDEAQAEVNAIRSRAVKARENLRTSVTPPKPTYSSSSSTKSYSYESEAPKSKNILSHLNTPSAMLNYKIQTARSLVRKQEDLLRNLARMRENMERSETEIGKASDYYISGRYLPRKCDSYRTVTSSRSQVQSSEPLVAPTLITSVEAERKSERSYSPAPVASISSISLPSKSVTTTSYNDYQPDEDFEREMAVLRKRVSDLTKKANDVTTTKYSPYYDYEYLCDSPSLTSNLHDYDIYKVSEPTSGYEVNPASLSTYTYVPTSYYRSSSYTPASTLSTCDAADNFVPQSSYNEYVLDCLNGIDDYSPNVCSTSYYDDLIPESDLSVVY